MGISTFWEDPVVNPINNKARSIPFLNPINKYGRVFHFSWFGFMIAFWAWYAFPPLLGDIIKKDLHLSDTDVLNSNIVALTATLLVRVVAGPCCDRWGARNTFAGCLIIGAIPAFCAGGIQNASGLMAVRFFIGILGGSFVPCQVWTTGFYDKNVVGTANALTAGFGNAGGGITYFVMPAIYNSLWRQSGLSTSTAWRVSFVVPGILIVSTAVAMVLLCPETPTGKWSEREQFAADAMRRHSMVGAVAVPGEISAEKPELKDSSPTSSIANQPSTDRKDVLPPAGDIHYADHEAHLTPEQMYETAKGEVVRKPTWRESMHVVLTLQTLVTTSCYFCSFGAELAINGILGGYYKGQFNLSLQDSGNWAAMFGLLNVVFRPLGGFVSDKLYGATGSVWAKKAWLHICALCTGAFLIAIGVLNSKHPATMYGLVAGMAFFLEAGNGANFSLVPHVSPHANGIMSGLTGAAGNLGGIMFAIIFRYEGTKKFGKSIWIIGVITIAMNLAVSWIRPINKRQIGGH